MSVEEGDQWCAKIDWWTGCSPISAGCKNCYAAGFEVPFTFHGFDQPLSNKKVNFVCGNSEFFYHKADKYRADAWKFMESHPQFFFAIVTKLPEKFYVNYPLKKWPDNVFFFVTIDEQRIVAPRLNAAEKLPIPYYGLFCEPLIEELTIPLDRYKKCSSIRAGGEHKSSLSHYKERPCYYKWCKKLSDECKKHNRIFEMGQTGTSWYDKNNNLITFKNLLDQENYGTQLKLDHHPYNWTNKDFHDPATTEELCRGRYIKTWNGKGEKKPLESYC